MSKKISPIPRGYRTATPCLTVNGVDAAIAFYQAAFDATLLTQQTSAGSTLTMHATIKIGNSIIALNQEVAALGVLSPLSIGGAVSQIHLYLDDVDVSWKRAVEAGASVRTALYDAYWGDRTGMLVDPNGHIWSLASKIENVSQDEIARRGNAGLETDQESDIEWIPALHEKNEPGQTNAA